MESLEVGKYYYELPFVVVVVFSICEVLFGRDAEIT